jgi:type II secretory pathway pseudopilin PulG
MLKLFTEKNRNKEAGFSLLELLLVVGVGALLLLAGIATYRLVTQGNNVNDAVRILATLKQQTQRAFQGQRTYGAGSVVTTLVAMEAFPAGVLDDSTPPVPYHPWGGQIDIVGAGQNFEIHFDTVPSDACISLATTFNDEDSDFVSLTIGGAAPASLSVADITTSCGTGATADMIWTFF